jgi:hypothetical protein
VAFCDVTGGRPGWMCDDVMYVYDTYLYIMLMHIVIEMCV